MEGFARVETSVRFRNRGRALEDIGWALVRLFKALSCRFKCNT
jgi:hypothetical protein